MSFHSSGDNSKVNELYCSPIGQLDVTGWSSYTNLVTVYINANEDDIEIIGTIPQSVICYYREGTNSEYFLTENIIVKALSSLLKLKADKSTTLEGYGITDGETTSHKVTAITSGANNTMYPSALAVYNALSGKESTSNKSTSVGSGSSHTQYPTSKAVYEYVTTVIQGKADKSDTYTKTEVDTAIQTAIGSIETQLSQV